MDLGDARIGMVLGTRVLAEFFAEAYRQGLIPKQISKEFLGDTVDLTLNEPLFRAVQPQTGSPYTRLELSGHVVTRPSDDPDAPPSLDTDFEAAVKLGLALKPREGQAPMVVLETKGIDGAASPPELTLLFAGALSSPELADALGLLELDMLTPMIEGLETIYYPEGDAPARDSWGATIDVLIHEDDAHWDGIGIFVFQPESEPASVLTSSPLPALMGLQFIYSRALLDHVLAASSQEQTGKTIGEGDETADLEELSLWMSGDAIQIRGRASKDDATITFEGPIYPSLWRGTTSLVMDTSKVEVDVDMPWYYSMACVLAGLLFFVPGLNLLDLALIPKLAEAGAAANAAPEAVRRGLASGLADGMAALAEGLAVEIGGQGPIDVDATTDHLAVIDGNMLFAAQIFVSVVTSPITWASYSKIARRFLYYGLEDGRKFLHSELARLVAKGKVVCPGYHDVKGQYMRSNPDTTIRNNLGERFER